MKILFLGDIVGPSGCMVVKKYLKKIVEENKINFVIANGENAAHNGVGITKDVLDNLIKFGVNVLTTGNHVWDHKETLKLVEDDNRLLRPFNLIGISPGKGFEIYQSSKNFKIGVLNLMGNVFMRKSEDVFKTAENFQKKYRLKKDYDFLVVDLHCETTSEKMAMGHLFDSKATLVTGPHTHVPTNDARVLNGGTALVSGRGELVEQLPSLPKHDVVLFVPELHVNKKTQRMFELFKGQTFDSGQRSLEFASSVPRNIDIQEVFNSLFVRF